MLSIGDLANSFVLRRQQSAAQSEIVTLTQEVSTGTTADAAKHLGGDLTSLAAIDHQLAMLEQYRTSAAEAEILADTVGAVLDTAVTQTGDLATDLLQINSSTPATAQETLGRAAKAQFDSLMSGLNTSSLGRSAFGGTATDRPAMADPDTVFADIVAAVSGQTTLAGIEAELDIWFDTSGGGFETIAYLGATQDRAPMSLSDDGSASVSIRADDQVFRDALKQTVKAALINEESLALSGSTKNDLVSSAANGLFGAQSGLIAARAEVGFQQERIETVTVRNSNEQTSLGLAKNALVGVDRYDAATRLEDVQFQLESIYTITARTSQLSLLEFMR